MNAKVMLAISVGLNIALLGAVAHLARQIPEQAYVPAYDGCAAMANLSGAAGMNNQTEQPLPSGTVLEALLPDAPPGAQRELLDLETGRRLTEPEFGYNAAANVTWIRANGLDISALLWGGASADCTTYYMAVVPVAPQRWTQATPTEIAADPALSRIKDPKRSVLSPQRDKTDTFLFRTAEGTAGILQIVGATPDHRNVKIRYKLATPAKAPAKPDIFPTPAGTTPTPVAGL